MSALVVPVLRLAVLCQSIEEDRDDRPFALEVPIHTLYWPDGHTGAYRPPTLELYLQLEDAVGKFFLRVMLRRVGSAREEAAANTAAVDFDGNTNRIIPLELAVKLERLAFPTVGMYEFLVYANQVCLHDPDSRVPIPFPPIRVTVLPPEEGRGGVL
jgi:hypothetical protein